MPTLTIKNFPDDLYQQLKARAEANRRSLDSEVLDCLKQATQVTPVDVGRILIRVDALRRRFNGPPQTETAITAAKQTDRA